MIRGRLAAAVLTSGAVAACSSTPPPRVRSSPPPPAVRQAASCPTCCDPSVHVVEIDPASTLGFQPSSCTLNLGGRYALEIALPGPRLVTFDLLCSEGDEAMRIIYRGAPVGTDPITDLFDPFHTGGREPVSTVNYMLGAPTNARYSFEGGELRFHRPPRARMDMYNTGASRGDDRGGYVELGLDFRFEGNRRFRAALRMCPSYQHTGPVSDPVH